MTNEEKLKIVYEYRTGYRWPDDPNTLPWLLTGDSIEGKDAPTLAEFEAMTEGQVELMQGDIDAGHFGVQIGALVAGLSVFGLAMPIDRPVAVAAINQAVRQDGSKIPDAMLILSALAELPLSDRRIYVAAGRLP